MNGNLIPYVVVLAVMAAGILILFIYRQKVAHGEDDALHVLREAGVNSRQAFVAQRLAQVDRWGKILTVVALLWGLGIAAILVYRGFSNTGL